MKGATKSGYSLEKINLKDMYQWTIKELINMISESTIEDSNHEKLIRCYDLKTISETCYYIIK